MGNTLDDLKSALSKMAAITRQLAQREYPYDLEHLNIALQAIFEGRFNDVSASVVEAEVVTIIPEPNQASNRQFSSLANAAVAALIPDGWTIISDVEPAGEFDFAQLKITHFLRDFNDVNDPVRKRTVTIDGRGGLCDLATIMSSGRKLPAKLHGMLIVFPSTLLRDTDGTRQVACLDWDDKGELCYDFVEIDEVWFVFDQNAK